MHVPKLRAGRGESVARHLCKADSDVRRSVDASARVEFGDAGRTQPTGSPASRVAPDISLRKKRYQNSEMSRFASLAKSEMTIDAIDMNETTAFAVAPNTDGLA